MASATVEDESFRKEPLYAVRETHFKIISNLKGDAGVELAFRHYDEDRTRKGMSVHTPQYYHFEAGQTYIVFAQKVAAGAQQVRMAHTDKMDLGVLRCR